MTVVEEVEVPQISFEKEEGSEETDEAQIPDVICPGDDPENPPEGTEWRGQGEHGK